MSKKVIVSGATGQTGSYMVEYLLANTDNTVIVAVRRTSQAILSNLKAALENPRVKLATIDLNDVHSITALVRDEKPDYFLNFGASAFVPDSWNSPAAVMRVNSESLIHILEAVRQHAPACRVYSAGSSEQFGDVVYSPQDEKHPFRPRSVYGVSKCAAAMIAKVYRESYGLYVVHATLFNHESERRQAHYVTRKITLGVARIARAIKDGKAFEPIELGNLDAQRDWSHAEDFVDGVWRMMNQDKLSHGSSDSPMGTYYGDRWEAIKKGAYDAEWYPRWVRQHLREYVLASGETHSIREFVEKAFAVAGALKTEWIKPEGRPKDEYLRMVFHRPIEPAPSTVGYTESHTGVVINPAFYRPAEVSLLHGDSTRARTELGWSPKVSFDQLVERMVRADLAAVGL